MKFDMLVLIASELEMMIMKTGAGDGALMLLTEETVEKGLATMLIPSSI